MGLFALVFSALGVCRNVNQAPYWLVTSSRLCGIIEFQPDAVQARRAREAMPGEDFYNRESSLARRAGNSATGLERSDS